MVNENRVLSHMKFIFFLSNHTAFIKKKKKKRDEDEGHAPHVLLQFTSDFLLFLFLFSHVKTYLHIMTKQ